MTKEEIRENLLKDIEDTERRIAEQRRECERIACREWLEKAMPEEKALAERAEQFEEKYFQDMLFRERFDWENPEKPPVIRDPELPGVMSLLVKIDPTLEDCGNYDNFFRTITLHPDHTDDLTLLHEMIHLYDKDLEKDSGYRDCIVMQLYEKLRKTIENLPQYNALNVAQHFISCVGGHSGLFLLKALELDQQLRKPWGSVYAYGQTDLMAGLTARLHPSTDVEG